MSLRDAVEAVAAATGEPKREVYRLALDLAADEG
jgi:16S rRNA (cytidine1402-2'-O)-methyltransferase